MKIFTLGKELGKAAAGAALCAGLLGAVAPRTAQAHILVKDEGETMLVRTTMKGAQGTLIRVRRNSADGKRALWFADMAAQDRQRKALRSRGTVALSDTNSNCRAVKYWNTKGATGAALPGQKLIRCAIRADCGAPLCSADMTCAGTADRKSDAMPAR